MPTVVRANVAVKAESIRVWQERFVHQNIAQTKKVLKKCGIEFIEACVFGKQHRLPYNRHNATTTKCGELIHVDLCGPFQVNSFGGVRYVLLLKDDYSRMRFAYFIKAKSEAVSKIKTFVEFVHNHTDHKIKVIRSEDGKEFVNSDFKLYFESKGIKHEITVSRESNSR